MAKTITLKQTGFWVEGTAKLLLWDYDKGEINMDPFHVMSLDEIPDKINDGRFGCQAILEAECLVYEDYEGTLRFLDTVHYDGYELADAMKGVCVA